MKHVCVIALSVVAAACGPSLSRVSSGEFRANPSAEGTPLEGATLNVNIETKKATLTPRNQVPIDLTLTAVDAKLWKTECPTQGGGTLREAWSIGPDPLVIGTLKLAKPELLGKCLSGNDLPSAVLEGDEGATHRAFTFQSGAP